MSLEYARYIVDHRTNVQQGFDWIQKHLPDLVKGDAVLEHCSDLIHTHDKSKDEVDEYLAYDQYFYGKNRSHAVVEAFNKAWLLHIHRNPHHWQYWVLIHDDPDNPEECIQMPYPYVIEMICDWWSFSWKTDDLYEVFKWYDEHKAHIKLHPKTRKTVEEILDKIKAKLDAGD